MSLRQSGMRAGLDSPTRRFPAGYLELPQSPGVDPCPSPEIQPALPYTWVNREAPSINQRLVRDWKSICWSDDHQQYVAVGEGTADGGAATSPDGLEWTAWDMPTDPAEGDPDGENTELGPSSWVSVAYGKGRYVAVADRGRWRIATSTNGQTWTGCEIPDVRLVGRKWTSVCHGYRPDGSSVWVAVADGPGGGGPGGAEGSGNYCSMHSLNGVEWKMSGPPDGLGSNELRYERWQSVTSGFDKDGNPCFWAVARRFLEPGPNDDPFGGAQTVVPDGFFFQQSVASLSYDPTSGWIDLNGPSGGADVVLYNPAGEGQFVIEDGEWVWTGGRGAVHTMRWGHTDLSWGYRFGGDNPFFNQPEPLEATHARWIQLALQMQTQPVWSPGVTPFSAFGWRSLACDPDTGVMIATQPAQEGISLPTFLRADPRVPSTFGSGAEMLTSPVYSICYIDEERENYRCIGHGKPNGKSRFVALGRTTSLVSDDHGMTWIPNVICGSHDWNAIAFGGHCNPNDGDHRRFVALSGRNAPDAVMWSPEGKWWHRAHIPHTERFDSQWRDILWDGRRFVGIASQDGLLISRSTVSTSPDGETWAPPVPLQYPVNAVAAAMKAIAYDPDRRLYVTVGTSGGPRVLLSNDLAAWRPPVTVPVGQWRDVCFGGPAGFVAVGVNENDTPSPFGKIATSPDGDHWTVIDVPLKCVSVAWCPDPEGGYYVAVTDTAPMPITSLPPEARILYSTTGVHWFPQAARDRNYHAVAWSPRLTVAVADPAALDGDGTNQIGTLYGQDSTWFGGAAPMLGQRVLTRFGARAIAAGRGTFAAVGRGTIAQTHQFFIATCWPQYVRPPLQTETILVSSVDELPEDTFSTVKHTVVGAPDTAAGAAIALSDSSDATWVEAQASFALDMRFHPPTHPDGLGVESFLVVTRCSRSGSAPVGGVGAQFGTSLPGLVVAQLTGQNFRPPTNVFGNVTSTRYLRGGGKAWTPEEFAQLRMRLSVLSTGDLIRVADVSLIVTYEPPEGQRGPL